jgi:methionyl aminopeptidase
MINIYSDKEIVVLREGGRILARAMKELEKKVRPGITTKELDKVAEDLIFQYKAEPSFKGFNNYPASLCTSINQEIVHGVPSDRVLKNGDILSLDLGVRYPANGASKGYCTDMAITIPVGKVDKRIKKLINITKKALDIGIAQARERNYLEDIGAEIQKYVEKNGFNVVRELCGHGVGKNVHEDPQVLNYKTSSLDKIELKPGMVLALEPMVTIGDWRVEKTKDGFCYKTKDNSLSAHFEHTIAITKKGPIILTKD